MERDYFSQQTLGRFSRLGDVLVREVGEAPYQRLEPLLEEGKLAAWTDYSMVSRG